MKKVFINIISNSLGDTIACLPYISEYQKKHNVEVVLSINDTCLFFVNNSYTNIEFVGRTESIIYDERLDLEYVFHKNIQVGYAEQLGFENPQYIRPTLNLPTWNRPIKNKYIAMGVHSTCQLKYWNHPNGLQSQPESTNWNELSSVLRKRGYTPVVVEKDELFGTGQYYNGVPSKANKQIGKPIQDVINLIQHSEFYIGLSSGMSWVAHALGKKVVMISNFTEDWNEFDLSLDDYIRVTNKSVCHGCWNRIGIEYDFNKNDWYWCPNHQNTERQFECHKSISVNDVIEKIEHWL